MSLSKINVFSTLSSWRSNVVIFRFFLWFTFGECGTCHKENLLANRVKIGEGQVQDPNWICWMQMCVGRDKVIVTLT